MTNITTSGATKAFHNDWKGYIYKMDMPVSTEVEDQYGEPVSAKIFAGELVQFKVKKVSECNMRPGAPVQEYKFISVMRNFCSKEHPINHSSAVYRIMAIGAFSPSTGRYAITKMMAGGERLDRTSDELTEHLFKFVDDAVNDYIYDDTKGFDGMEMLFKLPSVFRRGTTAVPSDLKPKAVEEEAEQKKHKLSGPKLFDVTVDGSTAKYPVYKLKRKGFAGIDMGTKLLAFETKDVSTFIDTAGFHTNRADEKHVLDIRANDEIGYSKFCEKYCN